MTALRPKKQIAFVFYLRDPFAESQFAQMREGHLRPCGVPARVSTEPAWRQLRATPQGTLFTIVSNKGKRLTSRVD